MMGRSHAASGAVAWLCACAAGSLASLDAHPRTVVVGAVVAAGAAVLPDIDHPSSTVARSLGPLTRSVARGVSWVADFVQDRTCAHCTDDDSIGHRALTHTALGCLAAGGMVSLMGWRWGLPGALVVVFAASALALLALLPPRRGRWARSVLFAATFTAAVGGLWPASSWWWLGAPVAFGTLAHCVGDALTISGCPVLWPLRIRGCRWARLGSPRRLRFRTGGAVETWLVGGLMVLAAAGSAWVLVA